MCMTIGYLAFVAMIFWVHGLNGMGQCQMGV